MNVGIRREVVDCFWNRVSQSSRFPGLCVAESSESDRKPEVRLELASALRRACAYGTPDEVREVRAGKMAESGCGVVKPVWVTFLWK